MEFALKLSDNKEIQAKVYLAEPSSKNAWERLNAEVRKSLKNPLQKYILRYRDDEGDFVTLTSQNEWEEMVRSGTKEILISSPVNNPKIEFMAKNIQPIHLAGLKFITWAKHEHHGWIKSGDLVFDGYEKPYFSNIPLNSSPIKEEALDGFQGVSIQWNQCAQHNHSGHCLFYHSSQLRIGNSKGKVYWPNFIDDDCIVFNGWIEYHGQQRQYWKGAILDVESMLKNEIKIPKVIEQFQFPQEPLDPQVLEDARQAFTYISQLNQLWNIGHRDVKKKSLSSPKISRKSFFGHCKYLLTIYQFVKLNI
jgi:hypothetical protein